MDNRSQVARSCKLCGERKVLRNSHVIPKSFFARMKDGDPQLYAVNIGPEPIARKSNGDQIEYLLCDDCEQFIQKSYENYGTQIFINKKNICESDSHVYITNFQYTKYYLFIISILWRASVSSLSAFKALTPLLSADKIFNPCLRNQSLDISAQHNIRLDDFIKITVFRIIDPSGEIPQDVIDKIMIMINFEMGETVDDGIHYYFMLDGYLVLTSVYAPNSSTLKNLHLRCFVRNRMHLKIPKVAYHEMKQIADGIAAIAIARDEKPKKGQRNK